MYSNALVSYIGQQIIAKVEISGLRLLLQDISSLESKVSTHFDQFHLCRFVLK